MYVQLWTASCVKTLTKFSAYQSTLYWVEMYCMRILWSLVVVPVIYSGLYISLYFSYIYY